MASQQRQGELLLLAGLLPDPVRGGQVLEHLVNVVDRDRVPGGLT